MHYEIEKKIDHFRSQNFDYLIIIIHFIFIFKRIYLFRNTCIDIIMYI